MRICFLPFLLLSLKSAVAGKVTIYGPTITGPLFTDLRFAFHLSRFNETVDFVATEVSERNKHLADGDPVVVATLDGLPNNTLNIPLFGFPLIIAYNIRGVSLQLTQQALVDIFLGRITHWNHTNISISNPGVTFPQEPITLVVGSFMTRLFEGMSALAGERINASTLSTFNTVDVGELVCASVKATQYSLGFAWMGSALDTEVQLAKLQNKDGYFVDAAYGASYAMSEYQAVRNFAAPGEHVMPYNMLGRFSWPLIAILYLVIPEEISCDKLQTLQSFLTVVAFQDNGMDQLVQSLGWEPASSMFALDNSLGLIDQPVNYRDVLFDLPCGSKESDKRHTIAASDHLWSFLLSRLVPYASQKNTPLELSRDADNIENFLADMALGHIKAINVDLAFTWEPVVAKFPQLLAVPMFMGSIVPLVNIGAPIVLSVPVLADIFSGKITKWNHQKIQELNSGVILPKQTIAVLAGPLSEIDGPSTLFAHFLKEASPTFDWADVNVTLSDEDNIVDVMQFTPWSIGYSHGRDVSDADAVVPRIIKDGQPVSFSSETLAACWVSRTHPRCWPFAVPLDLALKQPVGNVSCEDHKVSVDFVAWTLEAQANSNPYIIPNPSTSLGVVQYCRGRSVLVTEPRRLFLTASTRVAVYVLCGIGMVWAVCQGIALGVARQQSELKSASVLFSLLAVVGVFSMLVAPLLIAQDELTTAQCSSSMWFLTMGFTLCYGSLFAKLFRLYTIFTSRKLVVPRLSNRKLFFIVLLFLVIDFIFTLIYNALTPPEPHVFSVSVAQPADLVTGTDIFEMEMCAFHVESPVLYVILVFKLLVALCGAVMSFYIRQVDRRFSATTALGWSFYNMFLTVLIAIIIMVLFKSAEALEANLFTPIFCGIWIVFVTLVALTLDSNVLLACKDLSKPLRRMLNPQKVSKDRTPKASTSAEPVDLDSTQKRSHSSTVFVVNREMFPTKYDDFEDELLEKILEELKFQVLAVRRAIANSSTTTTAIGPITTSTDTENRRSSAIPNTRKSKSNASPVAGPVHATRSLSEASPKASKTSFDIPLDGPIKISIESSDPPRLSDDAVPPSASDNTQI